MKFANLQAARESYARQADTLQSIFEEAGADVDLLAVSTLDGDLETRTERLRQMNAELEDTGAQVKRYLDLQAARQSVDDAWAASHEPRPGGFVHSGSNRTGGLAGALQNAGFDVKRKPAVSVNLYDVLRSRVQGAVTMPAGETWAPRLLPDISPMGQDRRWLYPRIPTVPAGNDTAISDFTETVHGAVVGAVERTLGDTGAAKADLPLTVAAATTALKTEAIIVSGIPEVILTSIPSSRRFFEQVALFEIEKAIDAHVFAAIVAATTAFGNAGANVLERYRNAVKAMRASGFSPDLLVLNPDDSADLDTLTTIDGMPIFGPLRDTGVSSPMWGMNIVERSEAGSVAPYVLDTGRLGTLYLGALQVLADPYSGMSTNAVRLRLELNCLMHVRQPLASYRIAAA